MSRILNSDVLGTILAIFSWILIGVVLFFFIRELMQAYPHRIF